MVFLDNASTSMMYKESLGVLVNINENNYYNASALYKCGVESKNLLDSARVGILKDLGASLLDNLIFTSGATESNNMIIRSFVRNKNAKYIFSMGEHPSVYNVAKELESQGYNICFIPLDKTGKIDENIFKKEMDSKTAFVSIMLVSNETGAINDIEKLVNIAKSANPRVIFHTDAVQAFGKIPFKVSNLGVDALTLSAHKIHGPKGVGALFIKNGVNIKPFILGGGQENNFRSGTENLAGVMSFAKASRLSQENFVKNYDKIEGLSNYLKREIKERIPQAVINSDENCSPYIISCSIPKVRAESILYMLEDRGFLIGNGSACSSKKKDNRILSQMGVPDYFIEGSIRISLSSFNEKKEIQEFVIMLEQVVNDYLTNTNRR